MEPVGDREARDELRAIRKLIARMGVAIMVLLLVWIGISAWMALGPGYAAGMVITYAGAMWAIAGTRRP